ncbi:cell wall hydrolase [Rhizobium sp. L1K21]|uniref:cell wall hydrolase n=1 Tax=Rhizobium sp. L1K21 TaxID=2954933 RepID=UPI0020924F24|nr:cell wall hydrolase [Rhizobium sp. L1K21]
MRNRVAKRRAHSSVGRFLVTLALGAAIYSALPENVGRSDIAAYLAGINNNGEGRVYLTPSPAGSIQTVDMVFADPVKTGSVMQSGGVELPGGEKIAMRTEGKPYETTPDEDRVTRGLKKGRVVAIAPVQPPKDFSAGTVLDRAASLLKPVEKVSRETAFLKPAIKGKELTIAQAFYERKPVRQNPGVPREIASLVNNDHADVLATAYAPPKPDYSRQSPFDSILKADKNAGRFIPEVGPGDHEWVATALPADVFSDKEQQCLASGIYFEARGEPVKGQAAVAQVILNRVRNPTYPGTICGVVYQNKQWRNRCQFSFACDNIRDRIRSKSNWETARDVAMAVTAGKIWLKEVGSATHYHATYVHPRWARTMQKVGRIGLHIFYRTYGGGWS